MAISRKLRTVVTISASTLILLGCAFLAVSYYARRLSESDMLWVETKWLGLRLIMYAGEHEGHFPAVLDGGDFGKRLDAQDRFYIKHMEVEYSQPAAQDTNAVKLLVAHSRWERVVFYSAGHTEGAPQ